MNDVFTDPRGDPIDTATPFFDLGATSLTLVLAHRRLRAVVSSDDFMVIDLFANPTVDSLASFLTGLGKTRTDSRTLTPPLQHTPRPTRASNPGASKPGPANRRDARLAARLHAAEVAR